MTTFADIKAQFYPPSYPSHDFSGKTVIVTGANTGIGKEAVKHFVRLNAARVIGTARSSSKCQNSVVEVDTETQSKGIVEFWDLEYTSYSSVLSFASKVAKLDRIDSVILNAGIFTDKYQLFEEDESSLTVNVVSTILLAALLIPNLQKSANKFNTQPSLSLTGSTSYTQAKFAERAAPNFFDALNDVGKTAMSDRYATSKLLELFAFLELSRRSATQYPSVTINMPHPGFVYTGLARDLTGLTKFILWVMASLIAFTPEQGSRPLVEAASLGPKSHGLFLSLGRIEAPHVLPWIEGAEGRRIQSQLWHELSVKLDRIRPGVLAGF